MSAGETTVEANRRRAEELLGELGGLLEPLFEQLAAAQRQIVELENQLAAQDTRMASLAEGLRKEMELAARLKERARKTSELRKELHEKDRGVERLGNELTAKLEQTRQLRAEVTTLKRQLRERDEEIGRLQADRRQHQEHATTLSERLRTLEANLDLSASRRSRLAEMLQGIDTSRTYVEHLRADLERMAALSQLLGQEQPDDRDPDATGTTRTQPQLDPSAAPPPEQPVDVVDTVILEAAHNGEERTLDRTLPSIRPARL